MFSCQWNIKDWFKDHFYKVTHATSFLGKVGEDSWESLGLQGDPTSPSERRSVLGVHWKDWCWSWNSNTLATWCKELTHWKKPWCWERLRAGGEGDNKDEMVGWHHWLNGHEFGWTLEIDDGQGGLACCNSWGHKELDMTEWLNWTNWTIFKIFHLVNTRSALIKIIHKLDRKIIENLYLKFQKISKILL